MNENLFNQGNALFEEINKKIHETEQKTPEQELEENMSKRTQSITQTFNSIDQIRSEIQNKEILIRKSDRDKEFHNRRLRQNVKTDKSIQLKDQITLDQGFYKETAQMTFKVKFLN